MKIFDAHSDMLYDLYTKSIKGIKNRFLDYHVPQLKSSLIKGSVWTMYSPDDFDLIQAVKIAIEEIDLKELPDFKVILGLEGLRNLKAVEDIEVLYNLGIRHAMLTWNEENRYATGVKGEKDHGLKKEGIRLLKKMEELDMIIDVAHLNEKSFYEVLEVTNKNIIFSHGNVKSVCDHPRNLTDDQLKRLKEVDGLFGLTLAGNFVCGNKDEQDSEHFLNHLDKAVEIMGIDNVMFGFDFMDYISEFPNSNIKDVPNATYAHLIVEGMRHRGYNDTDISKICYDNFYNRYHDKIKEFKK